MADQMLMADQILKANPLLNANQTQVADQVMKDIHDIRPPVMVGMDPAVIKLGLWIAGGLMLAVVIFFIIRRLLRGRKPQSKLPAIPMIPPYETAMKALDRLGGTPAQDTVHGAKAFYFELGRVLKQYLGTSRGFNCLEMTTQELGKQLKSVDNLPGSLKSDIVAFQDVCDPFRYAPEMVPDRVRMDNDLAKGKELITAMEAAKADAEAKEQVQHRDAAEAKSGEGA